MLKSSMDIEAEQPVEDRDVRVAALKYSSETEKAPIVVASGSGFVASRILEIADECGINVYHDDSTATMLSKLKLGTEIPPELYKAVVDIYMAVLATADSAKKSLE